MISSHGYDGSTMWPMIWQNYTSIAHEEGYRNNHILAISLLISLPAHEIIFLGRVRLSLRQRRVRGIMGLHNAGGMI